jgi:GH35 family endo-1,4-beta-xylanase
MGNTAGARSDAEIATAFQMLSELGCTRTKWNFGWKQTEISPGNYDWSKLDYIAQLAEQYHISIILFCPQTGIPSWELATGTTNVPKDPEKYANFVYQVLDRYKGSMTIEYVEILNEMANGETDGVNPPYGSHWGTTASYAVELGNAIYDKVHAYFPGVKVGPASFTQPHGLSGYPVFKKE